MKFLVIFLILIGFMGITFALEDERSDTTISLEENYEIEIFGLKDEYTVGEKYSFYFEISGYGHPCANHQASYPDGNGNIVYVGAEVLCAPEKSMHEFEINSLEQQGTLGNTGIKKPGAYSITITFEKPSKYYPTTVSKEFRVVESIAKNFNKFSPLKQFKSGIAIEEIQCKENLILIQKYDGSPVCVKPKTIEKLIDRNWTTSLIVREIGFKTMSKNLGPECSQNSIQDIQNGKIDEICREYLTELADEHKSKMINQGYSFDQDQKVWVKAGYPDMMMTIVDYYLQNQPVPDPAPEPASAAQQNLMDARNKLREKYHANSSFGPFNIKDVIVGYGVGDGFLVVDILEKYFDSDVDRRLIEQKIIDITGGKVDIEFNRSAAVVPTNIESVFPYVWNGFLNKKGIEFTPKEQSYANTDAGYENYHRVCSPIITSNETEFYISSTFIYEPFEITGTFIDKIKPDDCYKVWKTDTILEEPDNVLMLWLENYQSNLENEN